MGEPAITVDGVSKRFRLYKDRASSLKEAATRRRRARYDELWALRDVDLEIARGTTYGLIGHNGSGKSTLLRLVAGIYPPTSGTITSRGRISALLELGAGFHPELSGRENVFLNGSILGMSRRDLRARFDDIVDFAGLGEFIDAPVKVYSSGMYVRLGFSVAVHVDPEILIIDEVIAVGDEEFQRRCFDHLYDLRRAGTTIVLVSHSLGLMESICDRAAWLDHGVLQREGHASDVVHAYLERVNEIEGERLAAGSGAAIDVDRHGSGEARITDVELLDTDGHPTEVGRSGEPLTIRLHHRAAAPISDPVVGLAIHHESGAHVAGPNTRHGGLRLAALDGDGHVDYVFDRLPLLPGAYLLSASIVDWSMLHVYDYRDRVFPLHVQPGSSQETHGLVDLRGRWEPAGSASPTVA